MKIRARPGSGGRACNKLLNASNPPADAPIATIGKLPRIPVFAGKCTPRSFLLFNFFFLIERGIARSLERGKYKPSTEPVNLGLFWNRLAEPGLPSVAEPRCAALAWALGLAFRRVCPCFVLPLEPLCSEGPQGVEIE